MLYFTTSRILGVQFFVNNREIVNNGDGKIKKYFTVVMKDVTNEWDIKADYLTLF